VYMTERFGAWQVGDDPAQGPAEFKIFFPDAAKDPTQYQPRPHQPTYGDPRIAAVRVVGDFMEHLGLPNWDPGQAPGMTRQPHPKGWAWAYRTPADLPQGFYQFKYWVTFEDGRQRLVGDPCARYGGTEHQNSAFVIGGSRPSDTPVVPVADGRKHLRDLVVYELMIDDFTDEYRGFRAPLDAVRDKLDYLRQELGVNAILFMPWTAWPGEGFSWGYTPHQYFAVEYRYANALNAPAEKLSWLNRLVNACHERGIHVIMDGVFNHVGDVDLSEDIALGFPYRWLYQDQADSPYAGFFVGAFPGLLDLDYHNGCTQEFIRDVCRYWVDFGIDGIRFDNTVNFFRWGEDRGLPRLLRDIREHVNDPNFSLTLEHLQPDAAPVTNTTGATSYWNNELYARTFDYLWGGGIDARLLGALLSHAGLDADKVATTYVGNHDHSHVAWQAGARGNRGALDWFKVQPYAIALLTAPGCPMVQNGQEFAEDYWIMEDDFGTGRRVKPRPLRWGFRDDDIGRSLFRVFARLISIRKAYPGLRSDNIYPDRWETWQTQFNPEGYGVDTRRGLAIFHRWGHTGQGQLQRFIVVLNCSGVSQVTDVPFSANGVWTDLLNDRPVNVQGYRARNVTVESNWGHVYFQ
jgi:1,4-alpha-glucan branching enzyme